MSDYLVTAWRTDQFAADLDQEAITITSPGHEQVTIGDWFVTLGKICYEEYDYLTASEQFCAANYFEDIDADDDPEIVITTSRGGNNGLYVILIYSLGEQLEQILNRVYFADFYFQDLNQDGKLELLLKQRSLYSFLPGSGTMNRMSPVTEILEYVPGKGYLPASCKYVGTFAEEIGRLENDLAESENSGDPVDKFTVYRLIVNYAFAGNGEMARVVIDEYVPQEDSANAYIVLQELEESLKSELCP